MSLRGQCTSARHSLALPARASVRRTAFPGTARHIGFAFAERCRRGRCVAVQVSNLLVLVEIASGEDQEHPRNDIYQIIKNSLQRWLASTAAKL